MTQAESAQATQPTVEHEDIVDAAKKDVARLMAKPVSTLNAAEILAGAPQSYVTDDGGVVTYDLNTLKAIQGDAFKVASNAEIAGFIAYCKALHLNPLTRECYFVKYKKDDPPAFITAWEVFLRRASRHAAFDGYEDGVIWRIREGDVIETVRGRPCTYEADDNHVIVGGWCRVYRKDRQHAFDVEVPLAEMISTKWDYDTKQRVPNQTWDRMLTSMATKTPRCRALRSAFPEDLAEIYSEDEVDALREALAVAPPAPAPEADPAAPKLPPRRQQAVQPKPARDETPATPAPNLASAPEVNAIKRGWWDLRKEIDKDIPWEAPLWNDYVVSILGNPRGMTDWTKDEVAAVTKDLKENRNPMPVNQRGPVTDEPELPLDEDIPDEI